MRLRSVEGGCNCKLGCPTEGIPGSFVGRRHIEGVHVITQMWEVVKKSLVQAPPGIDIPYWLQLVYGCDAEGCQDVVWGADLAVLKFDSIYFCGGGKDPDFLGWNFEPVWWEPCEDCVPVGNGLIVGVASYLDVISGNLTDSLGDEISEDFGEELIKLALWVEKSLTQASEDSEAAVWCHDA